MHNTAPWQSLWSRFLFLERTFGRSARNATSADRLSDLHQCSSLAPVRGEVFPLGPTLEGALTCGPLMIKHREPCGVAVLAFRNHMLAEDPFEGETETQSCAPA